MSTPSAQYTIYLAKIQKKSKLWYDQCFFNHGCRDTTYLQGASWYACRSGRIRCVPTMHDRYVFAVMYMSQSRTFAAGECRPQGKYPVCREERSKQRSVVPWTTDNLNQSIIINPSTWISRKNKKWQPKSANHIVPGCGISLSVSLLISARFSKHSAMNQQGDSNNSERPQRDFRENLQGGFKKGTVPVVGVLSNFFERRMHLHQFLLYLRCHSHSVEWKWQTYWKIAELRFICGLLESRKFYPLLEGNARALDSNISTFFNLTFHKPCGIFIYHSSNEKKCIFARLMHGKTWIIP